MKPCSENSVKSKVLNEILILNNCLKFSISKVRVATSLQSMLDLSNSIIGALKKLEGVEFF